MNSQELLTFFQEFIALNGGPKRPHFDGKTYEPAKDRKRLTSQLEAVRGFMLFAGWKTLQDIAIATGYPQSSVSARLRDLRKNKFGSYRVDRRRVESGLFEYKVSL